MKRPFHYPLWLLIGKLLLFVGECFGQTLDNRFDPREVALGRQLFFDPRLSINNTVSCATCHVPDQGWTDNRVVAVGVGNRIGNRNTPTCMNLEDNVTKHFFWDGVSFGLEAQVFRPIQNPNEHGFVNAEQVVAKLNQIPGYLVKSREIWGQQLTLPQLCNAIATYMRTLTMDDSPEHQYRRGDLTALTASQKRGRASFERLGCANCHNGENLRDGKFHNTGVELSLGTGTDLGVGVIQRRLGVAATDRGFKTPALWNVADTAPYFHNGRATTIDDVLDHYNRGGANLQGQVDPQLDRRVLAIRGQLQPGSAVRAELMDWLVNGCRGTIPSDSEPELPR